MAVLQGFEDSFMVFAGEVARAGKERMAESWVVENVSLGGFCAAIENLRKRLAEGRHVDQHAAGGGENWVLGIVRRFVKDDDTHATVGIQTLARQALSVRLCRGRHLRRASRRSRHPSAEDKVPGEVRMVLPIATFDVRETLEYVNGERRYLLTPIELLESCGDFEIAAIASWSRLSDENLFRPDRRFRPEGLDHRLVRFRRGATDQVDAIGGRLQRCRARPVCHHRRARLRAFPGSISAGRAG